MPELGGSEWAATLHGHPGGMPPVADLDRARALHELVSELVAGALVDGVHDCSDGGLAVALAEMAIAGGCGFQVAIPDGPVADAAWCFGESASRVVLSGSRPSSVGTCWPGPPGGKCPGPISARPAGPRWVDGPAGPVLEVALADATRAWRDAIPTALGIGALGIGALGGAPTR